MDRAVGESDVRARGFGMVYLRIGPGLASVFGAVLDVEVGAFGHDGVAVVVFSMNGLE